jgi:hypothetical protein
MKAILDKRQARKKKGKKISGPTNVAAALPEQQERALAKPGVAPPEIHQTPKPPSRPAAVAVSVEPSSTVPPVPTPADVPKEGLGVTLAPKSSQEASSDPPESELQREVGKSLSKLESTSVPVEGPIGEEDLAKEVEKSLSKLESTSVPVEGPISEDDLTKEVGKSLSKIESTPLPAEGRIGEEDLALVEEDLALVDPELEPVDAPKGTPYELRLGGELESETKQGTSPMQVVVHDATPDMALHIVCLPVTVTVHIVSTATQFIVGTCTHVISSTFAAIAGNTPTKSRGVEDETSGSLVDEIVHHVTHALPFALHVVDKVKDNIGGTLLGMLSPFFAR